MYAFCYGEKEIEKEIDERPAAAVAFSVSANRC